MDNQKFIQQAVDLALENVKRGGRPFAALVVKIMRSFQQV